MRSSVSVAAITMLALLCAHGATAQVAAVTPLVAQAPSCTTIAALATKSGVLGVLVSAAQAAGIVPELSDPTMVATVFAPDDNAFANLLDATGLTSAQLLSNTAILTQILNNHIVPGVKLSTAQLRTQTAPLPTLLGETLQVELLPPNDIRVVPMGGAPASILLGDLQACNAVVHIVDRVLLPTLSTPLPVAAKRTDSAATAASAASGESAASSAAASASTTAPSASTAASLVAVPLATVAPSPPPAVFILPITVTSPLMMTPSPVPIVQAVVAAPVVGAAAAVPAYPYTIPATTGYAYAPWTIIAQQPANALSPVAPGLSFTNPYKSYTAAPAVLTPNPYVAPAVNPYTYAPAVPSPTYTMVPQISSAPAYVAPGLTFPSGSFLSKLFHYDPTAPTMPAVYPAAPTPVLPAFTFQAVPVPIAPVPVPAASAAAAAAVGRKMLKSAK